MSLPHTQLADAAERVAADVIIMKSYDSFYRGSGFFLTKNSNLSGAKRKPPSFPNNGQELVSNWLNSSYFVTSQRKHLLYLANINDVYINAQHYNKLKLAYNNWKEGYYVVYYGEDAKWACNLFLGEALFMAGLTQMNGGKYYSAAQVYDLYGNFTEVDKSDVSKGDIAAFGGSHVEIVTKVRNHWIADDGFCSRGAGRGPSGNGKEKCDNVLLPWDSREIEDSGIKFVRVKM